MSNNGQARIGWIDEFKGFVLLLVCLFHIEQNFPNAHLGMYHLSALRMSAFFFISGFLFSTKRFTNFKSYFTHKTHVLLIPYLYLSFLFFAIDPVIYNFALFPKSPTMMVVNTIPDINNTWQYIYWNIAKIFIAGKSSVGAGPLWFVFTLYSVSLLFYQTVFRRYGNRRAPWRLAPERESHSLAAWHRARPYHPILLRMRISLQGTHQKNPQRHFCEYSSRRKKHSDRCRHRNCKFCRLRIFGIAEPEFQHHEQRLG